MDSQFSPGVTKKIVNALYMEAMVLADEARAYFDLHSRQTRNQMSPLQRVSFSCESLKVTTRLMHIIAWLLTQRAVAENAPSHDPLGARTQRLGEATQTDDQVAVWLPQDAHDLIISSIELYNRVKRLDEQLLIIDSNSSTGSARSLQSRLSEAY